MASAHLLGALVSPQLKTFVYTQSTTDRFFCGSTVQKGAATYPAIAPSTSPPTSHTHSYLACLPASTAHGASFHKNTFLIDETVQL